VSEEEWEARIELAAFYRSVARLGMTDLIANHITLKVPGSEDEFLINPLGLYYDEVTASSLMKINAKGDIVLQPDHGYGINYTGFVIHGAIHEARPEITCVAHTHTRAGMAVSAMECGLLMLCQNSLFADECVGYHDYEGPALNLDERKRLKADLGDNYMMILRNHGLLACGRTVAETFVNLYQLETSCRVQVDAMAAGTRLTTVPEEARTITRDLFKKYRAAGAYGDLDWKAELRKLDKLDPSYRQ
jgi:ribulose-5-phosphate 4-epimerase/fuculose-1-phosphate aldolase